MPGETFDIVSCCIIWWSLRRPLTDEWLVKDIQAMYRDAVNKVKVSRELEL